MRFSVVILFLVFIPMCQSLRGRLRNRKPKLSKPKVFDAEVTFGKTLLDGSGAVVATSGVFSNADIELVGIYFISARGCPKCEEIHKNLTDFYDSVNGEGTKRLEIIQVGGQRAKNNVNAVSKPIKWLQIPQGNLRALRKNLLAKFGRIGRPQIVFISKDGSVRSRRGLRLVRNEGSNFPWTPESREPKALNPGETFGNFLVKADNSALPTPLFFATLPADSFVGIFVIPPRRCPRCRRVAKRLFRLAKRLNAKSANKLKVIFVGPDAVRRTLKDKEDDDHDWFFIPKGNLRAVRTKLATVIRRLNRIRVRFIRPDGRFVRRAEIKDKEMEEIMD